MRHEGDEGEREDPGTTTRSRWGVAGPEPSLDEALADPIIRLLLRCDRLTVDDVRAAVRRSGVRMPAWCRPGPGGPVLQD
jgi:hypothetical protein